MVIKHLIVKLAMRCNIACSYCYWFKDPSVYERPNRMTHAVESALINRLTQHINQYRLDRFGLTFHGGEPLLFGKNRFEQLCKSLAKIEDKTGCKISKTLVTNGILIDINWITLFKKYNINLNVSIDGDKKTHDKNRIDFKNLGTYDRVVEKLNLLSSNQIYPAALTVANPGQSARQIAHHLAVDLKIKKFNVLIPDLTHEDNFESISRFYIDLFDFWFDELVNLSISIPIIEDLITVTLGGRVSSDMIGLNKKTTTTLLSDGSLQPSDELRSTLSDYNSQFNILHHNLNNIVKDDLWKNVYHYSDSLSETCQQCRFYQSCGGSTVVSRWSNARQFDNPSIYCSDWQAILTHVETRLKRHSTKISSYIDEKSTATA